MCPVLGDCVWTGVSLTRACDPLVFQVARGEMDDHLRDSMAVHLSMLCQGVTRIFQHLRLPPLSKGSTLHATREMSPTEMSGTMSGMVSSMNYFSQLHIDGTPLRSSFDPRLPQQVSELTAMHWVTGWLSG